MANDTLTIRLALEGGAEVRRELDDTAQKAEKAGQHAASGAKEATEATQGFQLEVKGLVTLFDEFERGQRGSFFATLGEKFKEGIGSANGLLLTVTALAGAFTALSVKGAEMASEIKEASIRVGTSAQNFSALKFVFEQSGAGAQNFERAIGVIQEAASNFTASADESETAAKKLDAALKEISKSAVDAEDARGLELQKLQTNQADRLQDLYLKQEKDRQDAVAKGTVDLVALQEEQDKQIEDERLRSLDELRRQQRTFDENRVLEQQAAFKKEQEALLAYNKELEDLADKSAHVQLGSFTATDTAGKLKELGVALQDANGKARDSHDIFLDVADRIESIDDAATRSQIAVGIFGRRIGPGLVESLSEGRKGILELEGEAKKLGLLFDGPELDIGKKFSDTLNKLGGTLAATSAKIGLAFAPLFGEVGEALAKAFGDAQPALVKAAQSVAEALKPIFDGLAAAIDGDFKKTANLDALGAAAYVVAEGIGAVARGIGAFFDLVGKSVEQIAGLIGDLFGTKVADAFTASLYLMIPAFIALRAAMFAVSATPVGAVFTAIGLAIVALIPIIEKNWPQIKAAWDDFVKWASDAWDALVKIWNDSTFGQVVNAIVSGLGTIVGWLGNLVAWAVKAAEALAAIGGAPATGASIGDNADISGQAVPAGASGGLVRGPGTGTSDSIPALLSNGEFVINALATSRFLPLLHAINSGRGFTLGGLVEGVAARIDDAIIPRFAAGGLALAGGGGGTRDRVAVDLSVNGREIARDMLTPRDVADKLIKAARQSSMSSGGTKPSWYR